MVKIHPIKVAYDKLPQSIKNTARDYEEGRDIIIKCLMGNAKRSDLEVVNWLKDNKINIKGLNRYKVWLT